MVRTQVTKTFLNTCKKVTEVFNISFKAKIQPPQGATSLTTGVYHINNQSWYGGGRWGGGEGGKSHKLMVHFATILGQ